MDPEREIFLKTIYGWFLTLSVGVILINFTYNPEHYGMILEKKIRELNNMCRFKTSFIVFWFCINSRRFFQAVNMKYI